MKSFCVNWGFALIILCVLLVTLKLGCNDPHLQMSTLRHWIGSGRRLDLRDPEAHQKVDQNPESQRAKKLLLNRQAVGLGRQVLPDGRIGGVHADTRDSLLELSPVQRGVVSIFGVASRFFVAMSSRGKLFGVPFFTDECKFKEILLPNNYNAYESYAYPGMFMALSKNGRTKKGNRVSPTMKKTLCLDANGYLKYYSVPQPKMEEATPQS